MKSIAAGHHSWYCAGISFLSLIESMSVFFSLLLPHIISVSIVNECPELLLYKVQQQIGRKKKEPFGFGCQFQDPKSILL